MFCFQAFFFEFVSAGVTSPRPRHVLPYFALKLKRLPLGGGNLQQNGQLGTAVPNVQLTRAVPNVQLASAVQSNVPSVQASAPATRAALNNMSTAQLPFRQAAFDQQANTPSFLSQQTHLVMRSGVLKERNMLPELQPCTPPVQHAVLNPVAHQPGRQIVWNNAPSQGVQQNTPLAPQPSMSNTTANRTDQRLSAAIVARERLLQDLQSVAIQRSQRSTPVASLAQTSASLQWMQHQAPTSQHVQGSVHSAFPRKQSLNKQNTSTPARVANRRLSNTNLYVSPIDQCSHSGDVQTQGTSPTPDLSYNRFVLKSNPASTEPSRVSVASLGGLSGGTCVSYTPGQQVGIARSVATPSRVPSPLGMRLPTVITPDTEPAVSRTVCIQPIVIQPMCDVTPSFLRTPPHDGYSDGANVFPTDAGALNSTTQDFVLGSAMDEGEAVAQGYLSISPSHPLTNVNNMSVEQPVYSEVSAEQPACSQTSVRQATCLETPMGQSACSDTLVDQAASSDTLVGQGYMSISPSHPLTNVNNMSVEQPVYSEVSAEQPACSRTSVRQATCLETPMEQSACSDTSVDQAASSDTLVGQGYLSISPSHPLTNVNDMSVEQPVYSEVSAEQPACYQTSVRQATCLETPMEQSACSDTLVDQAASSDTLVGQAACLETPMEQASCSEIAMECTERMSTGFSGNILGTVSEVSKSGIAHADVKQSFDEQLPELLKVMTDDRELLKVTTDNRSSSEVASSDGAHAEVNRSFDEILGHLLKEVAVFDDEHSCDDRLGSVQCDIDSGREILPTPEVDTRDVVSSDSSDSAKSVQEDRPNDSSRIYIHGDGSLELVIEQRVNGSSSGKGSVTGGGSLPRLLKPSNDRANWRSFLTDKRFQPVVVLHRLRNVPQSSIRHATKVVTHNVPKPEQPKKHGVKSNKKKHSHSKSHDIAYHDSVEIQDGRQYAKRHKKHKHKKEKQLKVKKGTGDTVKRHLKHSKAAVNAGSRPYNPKLQAEKLSPTAKPWRPCIKLSGGEVPAMWKKVDAKLRHGRSHNMFGTWKQNSPTSASGESSHKSPKPHADTLSGIGGHAKRVANDDKCVKTNDRVSEPATGAIDRVSWFSQARRDDCQKKQIVIDAPGGKEPCCKPVSKVRRSTDGAILAAGEQQNPRRSSCSALVDTGVRNRIGSDINRKTPAQKDGKRTISLSRYRDDCAKKRLQESEGGPCVKRVSWAVQETDAGVGSTADVTHGIRTSTVSSGEMAGNRTKGHAVSTSVSSYHNGSPSVQSSRIPNISTTTSVLSHKPPCIRNSPKTPSHEALAQDGGIAAAYLLSRGHQKTALGGNIPPIAEQERRSRHGSAREDLTIIPAVCGQNTRGVADSLEKVDNQVHAKVDTNGYALPASTSSIACHTMPPSVPSSPISSRNSPTSIWSHTSPCSRNSPKTSAHETLAQDGDMAAAYQLSKGHQKQRQTSSGRIVPTIGEQEVRSRNGSGREDLTVAPEVCGRNLHCVADNLEKVVTKGHAIPASTSSVACHNTPPSVHSSNISSRNSPKTSAHEALAQDGGMAATFLLSRRHQKQTGLGGNIPPIAEQEMRPRHGSGREDLTVTTEVCGQDPNRVADSLEKVATKGHDLPVSASSVACHNMPPSVHSSHISRRNLPKTGVHEALVQDDGIAAAHLQEARSRHGSGRADMTVLPEVCFRNRDSVADDVKKVDNKCYEPWVITELTVDPSAAVETYKQRQQDSGLGSTVELPHKQDSSLDGTVDPRLLGIKRVPCDEDNLSRIAAEFGMPRTGSTAVDQHTIATGASAMSPKGSPSYPDDGVLELAHCEKALLGSENTTQCLAWNTSDMRLAYPAVHKIVDEYWREPQQERHRLMLVYSAKINKMRTQVGDDDTFADSTSTGISSASTAPGTRLKKQRERQKLYKVLVDINAQMTADKVKIASIPGHDRDINRRIDRSCLDCEIINDLLGELNRFHLDKQIHVLPRVLRLCSEFDRCLSMEGQFLFLRVRPIPLAVCSELYVLKTIIETVYEELSTPAITDTKKLWLLLALGWLHTSRRMKLSELCYTDARHVTELAVSFQQRIAWYR